MGEISFGQENFLNTSNFLKTLFSRATKHGRSVEDKQAIFFFSSLKSSSSLLESSLAISHLIIQHIFMTNQVFIIKKILLTMIFLGKLILSAIVAISRNALINVLSALLTCSKNQGHDV